MSAGIGLLSNSALPLVTVEGENSVLYQQTARYSKAIVFQLISGSSGGSDGV